MSRNSICSSSSIPLFNKNGEVGHAVCRKIPTKLSVIVLHTGAYPRVTIKDMRQ